MTKTIPYILAFAIALSSCAKSYNADRTAVATPMGNQTYVIRTNSNAFGSFSDTRDFALLRAAEIGRQHGHPYFVILESKDWSKKGSFTTPGQYQSQTHGSATAWGTGNMVTAHGSSSTHGTYTPPQTHNFEKPRSEVFVRFLSKRPEDPNVMWFETNKVFQELNTRIRRGSGFMGF